MLAQIIISCFIFLIVILSICILYLLFQINTNLKQKEIKHINKHYELYNKNNTNNITNNNKNNTDANIDSRKENNDNGKILTTPTIGNNDANNNTNNEDDGVDSTYEQTEILEENTHLTFNGTQNELLKYDCDVETIYSMDDSVCSALCRPPNIYFAKNGQCVNGITFNHTETINNCNPKYGLVAYIIGDPQLGTTKSFCLSIDVGIQSDYSFQDNKICINGNIDINYLKKFPDHKNCFCLNINNRKYIIPSTNVIREHAICASENFQALEF